MSKYKAICIRCGTFKKQAFSTCPDCGLTPKTDFEAARALILAERTQIGDIEVGHTLEELKDISESIRRGRPFPIDGEQQNLVVREYYKHLKSMPKPKWPRRRIFKWLTLFLIAVVIAMGIWWLLVK